MTYKAAGGQDGTARPKCFQTLGVANHRKPRIEIKGKPDALANHADPLTAKENAAPAGPRNGAKADIEVGELPAHDSAIWRTAPSIIALHFAGVRHDHG